MLLDSLMIVNPLAQRRVVSASCVIESYLVKVICFFSIFIKDFGPKPDASVSKSPDEIDFLCCGPSKTLTEQIAFNAAWLRHSGPILCKFWRGPWIVRSDLSPVWAIDCIKKRSFVILSMVLLQAHLINPIKYIRACI